MTNWKEIKVAALSNNMLQAAELRQGQLTKPPGSLGMLEDIAIRLAAMQDRATPSMEKISISIFAGDHGITEEGISAFPQAVTVEMVRNFARGGAAICVLARELGADIEVINTGTASDIETLPGVLKQSIAAGTRNFLHHAAMDLEQLSTAFQIGRMAVDRAVYKKMDIFIAGEMGIGNTTAATAVTCALLDIEPHTITGPGTGLDAQGVTHKHQIISQALENHKDKLIDASSILRLVGGFEIAAITGAYLSCAEKGLPILVDGFIASAAALAAIKSNPDTAKWMFFAHQSAEPGHMALLDAMDAQPILNLGMRLGEGSGAAVAIPLMRLACALHNNMATFAEASVSEKL